jgi:hypothetical protein
LVEKIQYSLSTVLYNSKFLHRAENHRTMDTGPEFNETVSKKIVSLGHWLRIYTVKVYNSKFLQRADNHRTNTDPEFKWRGQWWVQIRLIVTLLLFYRYIISNDRYKRSSLLICL